LKISLKNGKTETIDGSFKDTSCGTQDERNCMGSGSSGPEYEACMTKLNFKCHNWGDNYYGMSGEAIDLNESKCVTGLKLTILSVYHGTKYKDTCISEISPSVEFGGFAHRTDLSNYENLSDSDKERFKPQKECELDK
jgi:hypothetical protein